MFLIRFLGDALHDNIEIINGLLHVVQCGFESKTISDKIASYDCWIVSAVNIKLY